MLLWRHSFSGGASEPVIQQSQQEPSAVGGDKAQLKPEGTNSIQPTSVPLRQLVSRPPPVTDTKPMLKLNELPVDSGGHVNCSSTAPPTALSFSELLPNSKEPYAFENDFVRGKLLFLLNPSARTGEPPSDPAKTLIRSELFEGKHRLFWVQLQLQFKQTPPAGSVLYIGGEVPRAMNLGFFTGRGCNLLLSILRSLVRGLHYSFGESDESKADSEDAELPHISFPLYTAVDQFVCTPAGQEPPVLGSADLGESKVDAAQRRRSGASGSAYEFNTKDTYSFHFHSYYIDFLRWQVTNVPGMKATDLKVFWEDMPLHLAAYFISLTSADADDDLSATHSRRVKKYQFCFQLSHTPRQPPEQVDVMHEPHRLSAVNFQIPVDAPDIYARLEEIQRQITKYQVHVPAWFEYLNCSRTNRERRVGYVVVVREYVDEPPIRDEEEPMASRKSRKKRKTPRRDRKTRNERVLLLPALAAFAPLSFLEHQDHSQLGKKKKSRDSVFATSSITVRSRRGKLDKIEGEREFLDYYIQLLVTPFAEAIAGDENDSRSEYTSSCGSDNSSSGTPQPEQLYAAQRSLLEMITTASSLMSLENNWPFLSANTGAQSASTFMFSSSSITSGGRNSDLSAPPPPQPGAVHVVRVLSSTQWRHEWLMLDENNRMLRFSRLLSNNSANKFAILLDKVVGVSTLDPTFRRCSCTSTSTTSDTTSPSPLYWLHIEKVAHCHHLAFASVEARRPWLELLSRLIEKAKRIPRSVLSVSPDTSGGKQCVLNDCSSMQLAAITASQVSTCLSSTGCAMCRPLDLVSTALKQALRLSNNSQLAYSRDNVDPEYIFDFLAFQDQVQCLQRADLAPLARSEGNRLVFFLNLYHLMVVHASLLGLLPKSKTQWGKFFNGASYRLGVSDRDPTGLFFSLAEIEHCVLRASMTSLRFPLASLVIPRLNDRNDPRSCLTLRSSDFRINFALNCMTYSCPDRVPIYDRANLDAQLDEATRQVVTRVLRYDEKTRVVYLPTSCDWHRGDFAAAADVETNSSLDELDNASLGVLLPYVSKEQAKMLEYAWRHPYGLIQRYEYVPYDFRFRDALTLDAMPPPAPATAQDLSN